MTKGLLALVLGAASIAHAQAPPPAGWSVTSIQTAPVFQTVALACSTDRAYVRNYAGELRVFDGRAWTPMPSAPSRGKQLWVSPRGRLFVDGASLHVFDGGRWMEIAIDPWFADANRVFAIDGLGESPWVLGRAAIGLDVSTDDRVVLRPHDVADDAWYALNDLEVLAPDDVYVASEAGLLRWNGSAWTVAPTGIDGEVGGVHAFGPDDVWAYGDAGVAHFDGRAWSARNEGLALPEPRPARFSSSGSRLSLGGRPGDVYLSTPEHVYRLEGTRWVVALEPAHRSPLMRGYGPICATSRFVVVSAGGSVFVHP